MLARVQLLLAAGEAEAGEAEAEKGKRGRLGDREADEPTSDPWIVRIASPTGKIDPVATKR